MVGEELTSIYRGSGITSFHIITRTSKGSLENEVNVVGASVIAGRTWMVAPLGIPAVDQEVGTCCVVMMSSRSGSSWNLIWIRLVVRRSAIVATSCNLRLGR